VQERTCRAATTDWYVRLPCWQWWPIGAGQNNNVGLKNMFVELYTCRFPAVEQNAAPFPQENVAERPTQALGVLPASLKKIFDVERAAAEVDDVQRAGEESVAVPSSVCR